MASSEEGATENLEERAEYLVRVKKEIRALLISCKHGCTPKKLLEDYLQVMGDNLPYHSFGYTNFMTFIQSIPDVVSVCFSRNKTVLYGVADSKTRKIQALVSKQRGSKKEKGVSTEWTTIPPRMGMVTKIGTPPTPKEPAVPSGFMARLKELMFSYPNGISLKDFDEAFAKRFNHYIAYRNWGFETLEDMIASVPDILYISHNKERNIKVVKRVAPQLSYKMKDDTKEEKGVGSSIDWYSLNSQRQSQATVEDDCKGINITHTKSEEDTRKTIRRKCGPPPPLPKVMESVLQKDGSLHSLELSPVMKKKLLSQLTAAEPPRKKPGVPQKIANGVRELLRANKAGIWVSRFILEYKLFHEEEINVSDLGYSSCIHLLHSLPCCSLERPGGMGDWLVYLRGTATPKVCSNRRFVPGAYVSEQLVRAVHCSLKGHDKGIAIENFPRAYKNMVGEELPVLELGFNTPSELLLKVPGVELIRPPGKSSVMVFSTNPPPEEDKDKEGEDTTTRKRVPQDWKKCMLDAKQSVYKKVPLPEPCLTEYLSIYVTDVTSPGRFMTQLIGKETTQALEGLQQDMTSFYCSSYGTSYAVEEVYPGQPCCATFTDGYWYRAEVEDLVCPDVVRIRYVDYGNSLEVPVTSIRRPKPNYLTLAAQAVLSRLCHLKPAGSVWSRRAKDLFKQMTNDKPLICIITSVKNDLMSLFLIDTTTDRDVMINDVLVEHTLALQQSDSRKDEVGEEEYALEIPFAHKDGELPKVRLPSESCNTLKALSSQSALSESGEKASCQALPTTPINRTNLTSRVQSTRASPTQTPPLLSQAPLPESNTQQNDCISRSRTPILPPPGLGYPANSAPYNHAGRGYPQQGFVHRSPFPQARAQSGPGVHHYTGQMLGASGQPFYPEPRFYQPPYYQPQMVQWQQANMFGPSLHQPGVWCHDPSMASVPVDAAVPHPIPTYDSSVNRASRRITPRPPDKTSQQGTSSQSSTPRFMATPTNALQAVPTQVLQATHTKAFQAVPNKRRQIRGMETGTGSCHGDTVDQENGQVTEESWEEESTKEEQRSVIDQELDTISTPPSSENEEDDSITEGSCFEVGSNSNGVASSSNSGEDLHDQSTSVKAVCDARGVAERGVCDVSNTTDRGVYDMELSSDVDEQLACDAGAGSDIPAEVEDTGVKGEVADGSTSCSETEATEQAEHRNLNMEFTQTESPMSSRRVKSVSSLDSGVLVDALHVDVPLAHDITMGIDEEKENSNAFSSTGGLLEVSPDPSQDLSGSCGSFTDFPKTTVSGSLDPSLDPVVEPLLDIRGVCLSCEKSWSLWSVLSDVDSLQSEVPAADPPHQVIRTSGEGVALCSSDQHREADVDVETVSPDDRVVVTPAVAEKHGEDFEENKEDPIAEKQEGMLKIDEDAVRNQEEALKEGEDPTVDNQGEALKEGEDPTVEKQGEALKEGEDPTVEKQEEALKEGEDPTVENQGEVLKEGEDPTVEKQGEALKEGEDPTVEQQEEALKEGEDPTVEKQGEALKEGEDPTVEQQEEALKEGEDPTVEQQEEALKEGEDSTVEKRGEALKEGEDSTVEKRGEALKEGEDPTVEQQEEALKEGEDSTVKKQGEALKEGEDPTVEKQGEALKEGEDSTVEKQGEALKEGEDPTVEKQEEVLKEGEDSTVEKQGEVLKEGEDSTVEKQEEVLKEGEDSTVEKQGEVLKEGEDSTVEKQEEVLKEGEDPTVEKQEEVLKESEDSTVEKQEETSKEGEDPTVEKQEEALKEGEDSTVEKQGEVLKEGEDPTVEKQEETSKEGEDPTVEKQEEALKEGERYSLVEKEEAKKKEEDVASQLNALKSKKRLLLRQMAEEVSDEKTDLLLQALIGVVAEMDSLKKVVDLSAVPGRNEGEMERRKVLTKEVRGNSNIPFSGKRSGSFDGCGQNSGYLDGCDQASGSLGGCGQASSGIPLASSRMCSNDTRWETSLSEEVGPRHGLPDDTQSASVSTKHEVSPSRAPPTIAAKFPVAFVSHPAPNTARATPMDQLAAASTPPTFGLSDAKPTETANPFTAASSSMPSSTMSRNTFTSSQTTPFNSLSASVEKLTLFSSPAALPSTKDKQSAYMFNHASSFQQEREALPGVRRSIRGSKGSFRHPTGASPRIAVPPPIVPFTSAPCSVNTSLSGPTMSASQLLHSGTRGDYKRRPPIGIGRGLSRGRPAGQTSTSLPGMKTSGSLENSRPSTPTRGRGRGNLPENT